MTFTESIKAGFSKLTDFSGRAGRSEYAWYSLFLLLVLALLVAGLVLVSRSGGARVPYGALVVLLVPLYLAWGAAQVRRLRDAGLSPWWTLANLIPYAGVLLVLALTLRPSRQDEGESHPGSLSIFTQVMVTGWGAITGAGALAGEPPKARNWWLLITGVLLLAAALLAYVYVTGRHRGGKAQPPAPVPVAPAVPRLHLMDEASGLRLYYDPSTARRAGPDTLSIQLVFDYAQAQARNGVGYRSLRQNETFNCAARSSAWTTRFYMSEPMGEGAAVLIEDGQGSVLDMSDSAIGQLRLDAVCALLPGLEPPVPAGGN